jgi:hypothetical protein
MQDDKESSRETTLCISENDDVEVFIGGAEISVFAGSLLDEVCEDKEKVWHSIHQNCKTKAKQCNNYFGKQEKSFTIKNGVYKLHDGCSVQGPEDLSCYKNNPMAGERTRHAIEANEPLVSYYVEQFDDLYARQKIKL